MSQQMSFRSPVFVGRNYVAKFEVIEVNEEKHRGLIRTTLTDEQTGKEVITGEAKLMHTDRF